MTKEQAFLVRQIVLIYHNDLSLSFNNSHPPLLSVSDVVANHMNST